MLSITFRSRVFSSDTLMDGEALVASHAYDEMDEKELAAELALLEDQSWKTVLYLILLNTVKRACFP